MTFLTIEDLFDAATVPLLLLLSGSILIEAEAGSIRKRNTLKPRRRIIWPLGSLPIVGSWSIALNNCQYHVLIKVGITPWPSDLACIAHHYLNVQNQCTLAIDHDKRRENYNNLSMNHAIWWTARGMRSLGCMCGSHWPRPRSWIHARGLSGPGSCFALACWPSFMLQASLSTCKCFILGLLIWISFR